MPQSSSLHLAIVMDGNGRWATRRGLPRVAGHRAGAEAVRRTVEAAPGLGVAALTLYAFSADNWKRPAAEVAALMRLLARYLRTETPRLARNDVRLELIGRRDRLPGPLLAAIGAAEHATARRALGPQRPPLHRRVGRGRRGAGASPPRGGKLRRPVARGGGAHHRIELRRPRLEPAPGIRHDRPHHRVRGCFPEHPRSRTARH